MSTAEPPEHPLLGGAEADREPPSDGPVAAPARSLEAAAGPPPPGNGEWHGAAGHDGDGTGSSRTEEPEPEPPEAVGAPAVVAVVVTHDAAPYLEATLAGLAAQDYPDLTILVVDAGSAGDTTDRVAAALPAAYVRRLERNVGFGGAANDALTTVEGAQFLLVCHDDVVLDPTALRLLVEEAYRSNAAIVGPKIVAFDDPSVLLDVGRAIDRLGGAHTGIEPGELDQEQHDGVRDVFYVSSATMLVRTDLFSELGGFDPDTFPGSEDLDLCWRARLAGARVVVAPDARVAHAEAADHRDRRGRAETPRRTLRDVARKRVRVVLSNYSSATLLWVVPFALLLSTIEAVAFSVTRRRREAFAELGAWWWSLVHPGRFRAARRRAQALRTVRDRDLAELQVGPAARLRTFLTHHRADERVESMGDVLRAWIETVADGLRHPAVLFFLAFLAVLAFGSRDLISHGVPAVGQLPVWPGIHAMFSAYGSAWRSTGLGSASSGPPLLVLTSGLSTLLVGSIGLARTVVVVGAFPVGAVGAYRLARAQRATLGPALVTAIAYAANPIARNAVAAGRFGPLVFFALAPFLVRLLVRVARFERPDEDGARPLRGRRPLLGLVALTAVATACYPLAAPLVVAAALAMLGGSLLTRGLVASARAVAGAVLAGAAALVLLFPWSLNVKDAFSDPAAFGLAFRPHLSLSDVLRFHTGPSGGGFAMWGLFATAAFALVVAAGPRLAWTARAWMLAAAGFAMVYLPARLAGDHAVAAPEGPLTLAALGLALAAGIGIGAFADELRRARFGWRQLAALAAGAGVALVAVGFAADAVDGRWHAPSDDWQHQLAFTSDQGYQGTFRILWLGRAEVLPLDPFDAGGGSLSYSLTRNGPGDVRELLRAPERGDDAVVRDAVALATGQRTNRLGRLLAPMGVRYVAVLSTTGPGGQGDPPPPGVTASLAEQLDLARLHAPSGLVLYENLAWIPERAEIKGPAAAQVPTGNVDPSRSALRTDLSADAVPLGSAPVAPGTALLGQAHDADWKATAGGHELRHERAFGWANAFRVPARSTVSIVFDGQSGHDGLLLAGAVPWIVLLALWWWGRRRDKARRRAVAAARRAERMARQRSRAERAGAADLELEDDFWSRV
ncbi:MAG TPA: glycosyltransferase family 2 protein [Acidimicrobiia bacterium]|nr:glycosyltransferase family 2 protein [Acidimicrobiia bacterium]